MLRYLAAVPFFALAGFGAWRSWRVWRGADVDGFTARPTKEAPAAQRAIYDLDRSAPARSRKSDGTLPSAEHLKQSPTSDHNDGNAFDLTHDPAGGADGAKLSEQATTDDRAKYVIWSRRIWTPAKGWQPYAGPNPHTEHVHVSVKAELRDDVRPWPWGR